MEQKKMTITEKAQFMEDRDDNKNFYDQFDRESPLYHQGCETPVPLGGQKFPNSMPGAYPEGFDPNAPVAPDPSESDPLCINLKAAMTGYREFKKKWTKVADAFVARRIAIKKANKTGIKLMSKKIRTQLNELKAFEEGLQANEHFGGYEAEQEEVVNYIEEVRAETNLDLIDEIKKKVTNLTRALFKLQNGCLKQVKERKKELAQPKAAGGGEAQEE